VPERLEVQGRWRGKTIPRRKELPNRTGTSLHLSRNGAKKELRDLKSLCYLASMKNKNQQQKRGDFSKGDLCSQASLEGCGSTAPALDRCREVPARTSRRGHVCEGSPCNTCGWLTEPSLGRETARRQFSRTFADILASRYGGSWSVEWQSANRSTPSANRNRRTLSGKK